MTIFQKLSWLIQMGVYHLCDEQVHSLTQKEQKKPLSLEALNKELSSSKSSLSSTATHAIGGVGTIPAHVLCILESPSADEDRSGVALSGTEGELLKKMLNSVGLDINQQTHVAYLSPWRAPGARTLTNLEIKEGISLLKKRIAVVQPKIILAFGMPVIKALTNSTLGQIRSSKSTNYEGIPFCGTFAPSFLIKNPSYKKQAWTDLQNFQARLTELNNH